jgi:ABC-type transporter Mla maintaining outer membrane lipid asymmetry ATPase subunit MlaF
MNEAVIEMKGVAAGALRDLSVPVVEEVNWTVGAGEYWVLQGLQGSGKTDFMMMTGSLVPPIRGTYRLYGEEMPIFEEARLKTRLRLGLVFDGGQLFNHLTVRQNVELPLRYHRDPTAAEAEAAVTGILEMTGLGTWADSTPGAMARNWHKRVGLARALILQPDVLLVDNPLGGLDPVHAQWWFNFLEQLSEGHSPTYNRPMTLVVTTAEAERWKGKGRRVAVIKEKRLQVNQ